jgi:hypothetical protein
MQAEETMLKLSEFSHNIALFGLEEEKCTLKIQPSL